MREAVIVSARRTAIGKAHKGTLAQTRPEDLAAVVIEAVMEEADLAPESVDDVIMGCAMPEGEQGLNIGRIAAVRAGLPTSIPGVTVNRFCSSGLQTIAMGAQQVMSGMADVVVAGGVESMSRVPQRGHTPSPHPHLVEEYPEVYMAMGHTAEEVAERFDIARGDQDAFALESHRRAAAAIDEGRFEEEIVPLEVTQRGYAEEDGAAAETVTFDTDEGVRRDTSMEALSGLRPVFRQGGTVTAGNASQTSDGAAAALVMSAERAAKLGLEPLGLFRGYAAAGVDPDVMGIGPVEAVPKVLEQTGLDLGDIDLVELNEAFASQSLYVIDTLGLDPERTNVSGGAIALGHPLGCTGAKLTATMLHELRRREGRYGIVTMCIGGGMGAAGVLEAA